ncbi:SnoaL-like domain-containing protein [Dyadobacter soli]|uniref:SnoaL-like domain-containing protein n=1 Tax=Dyadobacter soli TaxID=659014 RepID=UPI0035B66C8B
MITLPKTKNHDNEQIARRLAEYCRQEQFTRALEELYVDNAVSVEPFEFPGFQKETKGLKAMLEKDEKFSAKNSKLNRELFYEENRIFILRALVESSGI